MADYRRKKKNRDTVPPPRRLIVEGFTWPELVALELLNQEEARCPKQP